nr:carboxypeptidase regulatory-like domain-containing protein [uncultured Ottowia sp.]
MLVTVLDADSGQPLQGASVFFQGSTAYTSSNGQATALMVNVAGDNRITITRTNAYERLVVPLEMPPKSMRTELTVSLRKAIAGKVVFKGVVTDAGTQQPLAGVSVRLERSTWQTQTNAQGEYEFASHAIAGNKTAVFEKAGYQTHSQEVQIQGGATTVFNVALKPESASSGPARLEVSVQARGLGTPLAGAEIILTGANQRTAQTGTDGRASVENLAPGSTQIQISAAGHESAVASVHVEPGRRYELPVELLPQANPQHRLYGQVVDAVSQQPVAGAKVALTGAGAVTTAANGAYEFASVLPGDAQLEVTRDGYAAYRQTLRLTGTTEARIPLTPLSQPGAIRWDVSGTVVDADTLEPLAGAQLVLEEVSLGTAVLRRQTGATQADGRFAFNGLTQTNARVLVSLTGYDSALLPFAYQGVASQALDTIKLKRSYNAALPDLMVSRADRSALTMDDHTFRASGTLSATVTNNSNYDAGGFDVIAFIDANGNQAWDAGEDTLLGRERVAALAQQQSQSVTFRIRNKELPFRDAPIYVMADSGLEVIENIEGNNTLRVGVTCAGGGSVQDVGVCIDVSGSVSHLYNLEMEGVIKAVENPNIIPHDGSIRFILGTDREMVYGNGIPLHEAQIITPAVLPQLIENLKNKRASSGFSSGSICVRRMSEYMKTLPQIASSRTVITVGDGYWEGIARTQIELPKTVANGVSRVDVIGIGAVNLPELEANAWPKPANSQHGGKVTVAYSAGEVAAAMAQALGTAAQTVDLTLGRLRLIDQGAGQPVRLAARVGNAGSPAQASAVRFYQGTRLLGKVALPALGTGEWLDVALPAAALQGNDPLIAVVDEARANAECNVANNRQQITPDAAANALAALHMSTDQPAYGPNAPVSLNAAATNQGSLPADFELQLSIEDSQGAEVARFTRQPLGTLAASAAKSATQPWNTGLTLTGNYTLRGQLFDAAGRLAAQDSAAFAIVAGGAARPTASLAVATDKAVYAPDDAVFIANVAASLAANAIIDDASVQLTVRGPQGSVVFTHSHALGQLAPRALRELQAAQKLRNAPEGIYTVQASLIGSGHNLKRQTARKTYDTGVTLATATAQYTVQKNTATPTPTPTPSPSGRIAAVPASSPAALALLAAAVALTARRRKNGAIRRAAHHTCHLDHATQETQP